MSEDLRRAAADKAEQLRLGMCDCDYRRHKHRLAVYTALIVFGAAFALALFPAALLDGLGVPTWIACLPSGLAVGRVGQWVIADVRKHW